MFQILQAAGWTAWPLLACSVAALAIVIERFWALSESKISPKGLLTETISAFKGGRAGHDALAQLESGSLLGSVLAEGLRGAGAGSSGEPADWEEPMAAAGKQAAQALEARLSALATLASAAPLLGLLGTVVGMIEIFGAQNALGSDPAALARGISVALYNTAFGLLVAIPSLIFWRYFRSRADREILSMEVAASKLSAAIKSEKSPRAARPRKA